MLALEEKRFLFGTELRIKCCFENSEADFCEKIFLDAFAEMERIQNTFSRFEESSELGRLNQQLGSWVEVSEELFSLLEFGDSLKSDSGGFFNMGVGSVLESWGYGLEGQERVFEKGEFGGIEFREGNLLRASSPIDLGAFGKGYAADKAAEILKSVSQNFLIDAGGDILAFGGDLGAGHKSFKIAFENPLDPKEAIGFVQSDRMALASSSAQKRKWGDKHHLVDGKNLQCAEDMLAVFVQGEDLMSADAYSTLLFVMGFERAREYLQKRPQKFEALILQSDFSFYRTESFEGELFLG